MTGSLQGRPLRASLNCRNGRLREWPIVYRPSSRCWRSTRSSHQQAEGIFVSPCCGNRPTMLSKQSSPIVSALCWFILGCSEPAAIVQEDSKARAQPSISDDSTRQRLSNEPLRVPSVLTPSPTAEKVPAPTLASSPPVPAAPTEAPAAPTPCNKWKVTKTDFKEALTGFDVDGGEPFAVVPRSDPKQFVVFVRRCTE